MLSPRVTVLLFIHLLFFFLCVLCFACILLYHII
uniref:Uncharacterized protein n=1 Tax=Anguilla anguilla TaxID=7936 RepID=A0A0E9TE67_ANGAN